MHNIREILDGIYYVGVNDRRIDRFENMFPLENGVSYSSYVIKDEKNALVDSVESAFTRQYLENIEAALDGEDLDYIIVHHMEPDHCRNIDFCMRKWPNAKLVGNAKTFQFYEQFYNDEFKDRYYEVKEGDELNFGKHTLKFVMTPMVHWPEVMMSYETSQKILFSADAFGSFNAIEGHLKAKNVMHKGDWLDQARRYYINIVGKFGNQVQAAFKKVADLDIQAILPLHGPVYDDPESIGFIMDKYNKWSTFTPEEKGVAIVYSTMYGDTEQAADILAAELAELGVTEDIRVFDVSDWHPSDIIAQCHKYSNTVFGPINYNSGLYYPMEAFLQELVGTGYQNRHVSFLNNWSWGGNSLKRSKEILEPGKHTYVGEDVLINSAVKDAQVGQLKALAKAIKEDLDSQEDY